MFFGEIQSQPNAAVAPSARAVELAKQIENQRDLIPRDTFPAIAT